MEEQPEVWALLIAYLQKHTHAPTAFKTLNSDELHKTLGGSSSNIQESE